MTGRQAILICRHYFKESAIDRKHTDRRRFEAVRLVGDDVEGYWNVLTSTMNEMDPANLPSDFELMDAALQELRKSKRFASQLDYWNLTLADCEKTWMNLQTMLIKYIERTNELKTSQQIRDQPLAGLVSGGKAAAMKPQPKVKAAAKPGHGSAGARSTTPKKKGVCYTWRSRGYCNKGDACQWDHPDDQKGNNPKADRWASGGSGGSAGGKRSQSTDAKKVCKLYLKGKCAKSHELCNFIHNPTCWFFQHKGDCKLGDKCLFPHRGDHGVLVTKPIATEKPQQAPLGKMETARREPLLMQHQPQHHLPKQRLEQRSKPRQ